MVREVVLADTALGVPLTITKRGHEIDYEARAVTVGARRYILCRNHQEAERDAAAREAILITHSFIYYDDTRYDWKKYGAKQRWNPHGYGIAKATNALQTGAFQTAAMLSAS